MSPYRDEHEDTDDELDGLRVFDAEAPLDQLETAHRTKGEMWRTLREAGFKRDSYRWADYVQAKQMLFGTREIDTEAEETQLDWICEYFGI